MHRMEEIPEQVCELLLLILLILFILLIVSKNLLFDVDCEQ